MNYESMKTNFRVFGAPSALALAAAYNHELLFEEMLTTGVINACDNGRKISLEEFFCENSKKQCNSSEAQHDLIQRNQSIFYNSLNRFQRRAMSEAELGVPWSGYCWLRSLQTSCEDITQNTATITTLLDDFNQLVPPPAIQDFQCSITSAKIISNLFKLSQAISPDLSFNSLSCDSSKCLPSQDVRPLIDPKFVDNPELSDIRFSVQGRIIHAHRIVLVNASERFRDLLKNPSGVVELKDVTYSVFKTMLEYLYSHPTNACVERICQNKDISHKLELITAAKSYGLNHLCDEYQKVVKATISTNNCFQIHAFATVNIYQIPQGN
uniref:BTB domain-containing protein n=1 Tax=Ditylenchus dipsaci TaxID=166011 RepID=A0A915CYY4_9BILA